ncbi:MAG: monovalent cation/H(+) antiporter subunit G [Armatimonadota bacterium]|nr:monovalent cation/H(+) antiporter subunit G [Armatimonadota bacterium]MDR7548837.1 monovalent cation/H(+) antiporter subunit G [Armatimonadota bacterium]
MSDQVVALILLGGASLSLIAALGLHRFADAYARLHAATKSATLGLALVLTAAVLAHGTNGREILTLLFVLLTSPVGAHMVSKAMYESGYRPWEQGTGPSGSGPRRPGAGARQRGRRGAGGPGTVQRPGGLPKP